MTWMRRKSDKTDSFRMMQYPAAVVGNKLILKSRNLHTKLLQNHRSDPVLVIYQGFALEIERCLFR